jgi:hypothetical protein
MIVVADSGPLHDLILLEQVDLLRRFYGQVLVPDAVANELSVADAPGVVREWMCGERSRSEGPVTADGDSSQKNDECHSFPCWRHSDTPTTVYNRRFSEDCANASSGHKRFRCQWERIWGAARV